MLIRDNLRRDFYDVVRKKHVIIFAANDVDSLCASSILTHLFMCDDVLFSLLVVGTWSDLERQLREHSDQDSNIILLNCGGNRSLLDLPVPSNSQVFVLDSHRPIDIDNAFDDEQIKIVLEGREVDNELKIPAPEDVFEPESEDENEEEEEEEGEEGGENRPPRRDRAMQRAQRNIIRKEEKRRWKTKQAELLWNYYETSWTSLSTSVLLLSVASELSRATAELFWLAAVGLSSQFTDGAISLDAYNETCVEHMQPYIAKFAPRVGEKQARADDLLRIKFERDIPLALYQHWTLWNAMSADPFFSCLTRNWMQKGDTEMKHQLRKMELTLAECRQNFSALPIERKKEVIGTLLKTMNTELGAFVLHRGFSARVTAIDVARGLAARLDGRIRDSESGRDSTNTKESRQDARTLLADRFEGAREMLEGFLKGAAASGPEMERCFGPAKDEIVAIFEALSSVINQSEILPNGHFYLYSAKEHLPWGTASLFRFLRFLAAAFSASKKGRNTKPLIVCYPHDSADDSGYHLVAGIMPLATVYPDNHIKTFLGRAFERATQRSNITAKRDFFDPSVLLVKSEHRSRFLDTLQLMLETVN